ncbi:hypothetical protein EJ04DRAFT_117682 [Polyplosphaeria fusca]|uniref:UBC core domain-containing protein n=1 Tax=Polyplosphaeria fusca TaxID=682080 RepID=A0A9P4V468_9PLEO|nr:hypothetical protein EJ04DRAFT_117682 [Polyplosphaeria fusca]
MDDDDIDNANTDQGAEPDTAGTGFPRWLGNFITTNPLLEHFQSLHSPQPPSAFQQYGHLVPYFSAANTIPGMDAHGSNQFCVEDSVGLKEDRFMIGIVDRTFGDVDSHEPRPQRDYSEDIERNDAVPRDQFNKFLRTGIPPRGTVLVAWQSHLKTELIPETKLELLDRALYVGDVVKKSAKDAMSGTVIGTRAVCTLLPVSGREESQRSPAAADDISIRCVPANELINVHEYNEGSLAIYNNWVGRIEQVNDEVAVKLSNNSVVIVEYTEDLEPDDPDIDRLSVGDAVTTKKGNLRRGRWKYGAYDPHVRPEGVVVEVRTVSVQVRWLARAFLPENTEAGMTTEPPAVLESDELAGEDFHIYDAAPGTSATLPMSGNGVDRSYHIAEVAVGDRVRFKDITAAAAKYDGSQNLPNGYPVGKLRKVPRTETLGYDMNVFLVMQTHSCVTVQWQDLTVTENMSPSLIPDPNVGDDDEVWPGEIVCTKEQREDKDPEASWSFEPAKVGIVQTVKPQDRIATVRWFKNCSIAFYGHDLLPPATTGDLAEETEDVSLYDIRSTPSLTRRRGDFVMIHPLTAEAIQAANEPSVINWFGEVVDLGIDGYVTVRLGASKPVIDVRVKCERVTLVYSSDMDDNLDLIPSDGEGSDEDDDDDEDASDFDSASFNEMWVEYEGMDGEEPIDPSNDDDWSTEDEDTDTDLSMPDPEFADQPNQVDTSKTTPEAHSENEPKDLDLPPGSRMAIDSDPSPTASAPDDPASRVYRPPYMPLDEELGRLVPFQVLDVTPPPDHHYFNKPAASSPTLMRRIAKEHKILSSSLPPGILVRTWESRLDLLRVMMIGPSGTPYEYAPFMIDFHLDSQYPTQAPQVFFHSWTDGNGPVNPNLYEDGKICLSLLGTWHTDERNESWSPAKSTLLQVLVSIQALVLVREPYYNEAGYDVHRQTPETKLSSALYTERSYFRARGFIVYALEHSIQPFRNELVHMYYDDSETAPKLLDQAIDAANKVILNSEDPENQEERDGLNKISLGAVVMLKRQVAKLEYLKENFLVHGPI